MIRESLLVTLIDGKTLVVNNKNIHTKKSILKNIAEKYNKNYEDILKLLTLRISNYTLNLKDLCSPIYTDGPNVIFKSYLGKSYKGSLKCWPRGGVLLGGGYPYATAPSGYNANSSAVMISCGSNNISMLELVARFNADAHNGTIATTNISLGNNFADITLIASTYTWGVSTTSLTPAAGSQIGMSTFKDKAFWSQYNYPYDDDGDGANNDSQTDANLDTQTDGNDAQGDGNDKQNDGNDKQNDGNDAEGDGNDKQNDGNDAQTDGNDGQVDGHDQQTSPADRDTDINDYNDNNVYDKEDDGNDKDKNGWDNGSMGDDSQDKDNSGGADTDTDGNDYEDDGNDSDSDWYNDSQSDVADHQTDGNDKQNDAHHDTQTDVHNDSQTDAHHDTQTDTNYDTQTDATLDSQTDANDKQNDGNDTDT